MCIHACMYVFMFIYLCAYYTCIDVREKSLYIGLALSIVLGIHKSLYVPPWIKELQIKYKIESFISSITFFS